MQTFEGGQEAAVSFDDRAGRSEKSILKSESCGKLEGRRLFCEETDLVAIPVFILFRFVAIEGCCFCMENFGAGPEEAVYSGLFCTQAKVKILEIPRSKSFVEALQFVPDSAAQKQGAT